MRMSKLILSYLLSITLFAQVSWAEMASTELLLEQPVSISSKEKVIQFIEREDVVKTLGQLGVDPTMAKLRVAAMSDAAIFIFIVLLITDILGLTKVFSFTRPIRH